MSDMNQLEQPLQTSNLEVNELPIDNSNDKSNNKSNKKKKNKKKGLNTLLIQQIQEQQAKEEAKQKAEEARLAEIAKQKAEELAKQKEIEEAKKEAQRQKNAEKRVKAKDNKKEKMRLETLARLGIDPTKISTGNKKPVYGKKRKLPPKREPETSIDTIDNNNNETDDIEDWERLCDEATFEKSSGKTQSLTSTKDINIKEPEVEVKEPEKEQERIKAPICCILGNVDAGKTTFVDNIRSTKVQQNEAGGITQTINTVFIEFKQNKFNLPGAILIDTPGHDSFYNLRSFGASLCNFVILMVDIMEGVKEQTKKSIELIKQNKIPYIVVLNKLDRVYGWQTNDKLPFSKSIVAQKRKSQEHFEDLVGKIIQQLSEEGLNTELHYRNTEQRSYASMFPVSSRTGEGIKELFGGMIKLITKYLKKEIQWSPEFKGVLTDTNIHKGLGRYISLLMYDGHINKKDTLVMAGTSGPVVKQISKLVLMNDKKFTLENDIYATRQLEVVFKGSDEGNYVMGSPIYHISSELSKNDMLKEIDHATKDIEEYIDENMEKMEKNTSKHGVLIHASSFGGLTAIMEYLDEKGIPYVDAKIGIVKKQDIAKVMNFNTTPETQIYNIVICFNTGPDKRAQQEFQSNPNVMLIQEDIIYRIFEQLENVICDKKGNIRDQYEKNICYPAILEIMPEHIYATRDPIIMGVNVKEGLLKRGTIIQCLKKGKSLFKRPDDLIILGTITNIRNPKGDSLQEAKKGDNVSIQIDNYQQQTPKLFKRDFDENTELWTQMTGDSYYIMKKYFYDDMDEDCQEGFHKLSQIYSYEQKGSHIKKEVKDDNGYW